MHIKYLYSYNILDIIEKLKLVHSFKYYMLKIHICGSLG